MQRDQLNNFMPSRAIVIESTASGCKTPRRRASMNEAILAPSAALVAQAIQQQVRSAAVGPLSRRRCSSDTRTSYVNGLIPTDSAPNVFSMQLQSLIDRESSYISTIDMVRDVFWMPLARRYLSSGGRQTGPVNHRRRFSLMGFMHVPPDPTKGDIMRTLNGLFGYLPAIRTFHHCLLEELKVLHALAATIAEVAALIRVRVMEEFEVYISQIANYSIAMVDFENLCFVDDSFRRAVEECTLQAGGMDIRALLRRPVDRVSQYISFFETVLTQCTDMRVSHHDYNSADNILSERDTIEVNRCIETMESLVARINPWVERVNHTEEIASLQSSMTGRFDPFLSLGQTLVHQGEFWMTLPGQETEKHVHAWLLSDRLVLAEALKQRGDLSFAHRETIFLNSSAILASADVVGQTANTLKVYVNSKKEMLLRSEDHYSFMKWRTILRKQ